MGAALLKLGSKLGKPKVWMSCLAITTANWYSLVFLDQAAVELREHKVTTDERLERLTGIVESLAASVVEHDDQIESLIKVAQKHEAEMADIRRSHAETLKLLEAYLRRLPPQ
jgi:hypothetical protein